MANNKLEWIMNDLAEYIAEKLQSRDKYLRSVIENKISVYKDLRDLDNTTEESYHRYQAKIDALQIILKELQ